MSANRDMLNRLLEGFEGSRTSSKWAKFEKCSHDIAVRDINELVELRVLKKRRWWAKYTLLAYGSHAPRRGCFYWGNLSKQTSMPIALLAHPGHKRCHVATRREVILAGDFRPPDAATGRAVARGQHIIDEPAVRMHATVLMRPL